MKSILMHRVTRRSSLPLLLLTAAIVVTPFAGAALAAGNSLSIKPPINAKVGKSYSFTVSGVAASAERLYLFDDIDACGPSPHVEHAVHNANGDDFQVSGSFTETSHGWRSPKATSYNICAYLVTSSAPYNPTSGYVLARTSKSFKVSRAISSNGSLPKLVVRSWSGIKPTTIDFSGDAGNVVTSIAWASWTGTQAVGHGTSNLQGCIPDCAQGSETPVPTTITVSNPQNGRFTRITETRNGMTTTGTYGSNGWPLNAS